MSFQLWEKNTTEIFAKSKLSPELETLSQKQNQLVLFLSKSNIKYKTV